jgi:hypothetical protein
MYGHDALFGISVEDMMVEDMNEEYTKLFTENTLLMEVCDEYGLILANMSLPTLEQAKRMNDMDVEHQKLTAENMMLKDMIVDGLSPHTQNGGIMKLVDENTSMMRQLQASCGPRAHQYASLASSVTKTMKQAKSINSHQEALMNEAAECLTLLHAMGLDMETYGSVLEAVSNTKVSPPESIISDILDLDATESKLYNDISRILQVMEDQKSGGEFHREAAFAASADDACPQPPREEDADESSEDDVRQLTQEEILTMAAELAAARPPRQRRRHNVNGSTRARRRRERARQEAAAAAAAGPATTSSSGPATL